MQIKLLFSDPLTSSLAGLTKAYYEDSIYYEYDDEPPSFQARSQTFTVEVGQSVIIPCDVDNIGQSLSYTCKHTLNMTFASCIVLYLTFMSEA